MEEMKTIVAGKCFKFLTVDDDNNIVLRHNSDYLFRFRVNCIYPKDITAILWCSHLKTSLCIGQSLTENIVRDHCCQNWITFTQITSDPISPPHFNL